MVEIRSCTDYRLLAEMNEEIQTLHHTSYPGIFKPYDKEAILEFFKNTLTKEGVVAYIAVDQGAIIGYVLLFKMHIADNPFQYARTSVLLDQILVSKNHQAKGVGRLLMAAVFAFAKSNEIERIELNHWTQNASARTFFHACGFEYYNEKMWHIVR